MHLQSLKLLRPTVMSRCFYKKIQHLALALGSNVTFDVAQCPLYHMTCAPANFEVAASNSVGDDAFYIKIDYLTFDLVARKVVQYPKYYVTYTAAKVEVATANGSEGDAFT